METNFYDAVIVCTLFITTAITVVLCVYFMYKDER